jgi:hypothetical protein
VVGWWKKEGDMPENESENENFDAADGDAPADAETPAADVPDWVPSADEVEVLIDGKAFMALSLYELPGPAVLAVQSASQDAEKMVGIWNLLHLALPPEGLARLEVLSFSDLQEVLTSWTMASAQKQAEAYAARGRSVIEELLRGSGRDGGRDGRAS